MKLQSVVAAACLIGTCWAFWSPTPVKAADREEQVRFASGATSAQRTDTIRGYDGIDYVLGAEAGQTMSVNFNPDNPSCYFNITPPGSRTAIFNGSITGNQFAQELPSTGEYTVQVYLMRNAARRNETCTYDISFEISATEDVSNLGDLETIAAEDNAEANPYYFTRRGARRACRQRITEQYGVRRSAFSDISVRTAGDDHYWVKGKIERYNSRPDTFTCRVVHGEVIAFRVQPPDRPGLATGKGVLGTTLKGTPVSTGKSDFENAPHPPHARGNPFRDRHHLNRACRHEIARQLRHSHARFDSIRLVTGHLRNRALQGDGSVRWDDSDHLIHFTCHFDRRGRVVDGQFYYYPAQPAVYRSDYADGMSGGPDNWRVIDVASNDVLWVHRRASLASPRIGSLPHNARGVRNFGCQWSNIDKGTWCEIEYRGLRGFAAQRYLSEDS